MKGFIFHNEYYETLKKVKKISDKQAVLNAILDFVFENKEPQDLSEVAEIVFETFRKSLTKSKNNSGRGGRKKINRIETESKPNENRIETESEPIETELKPNETDLKPIKNRIEREREIPYKELPREKDKERSKEKEKYNPQENLPQEKETDPLTPLGGWSDGQTYENKAQKEFFALYPKIRIDNYSPSEYSGIDFELLIRRFEESEFLRGAHSFSFICKNYPKIAAGEYRDFYRRLNFQENKLGSEWDDLK